MRKLIAALALMAFAEVSAAQAVGPSQAIDRYAWCSPTCPILATQHNATQQGFRFDASARIDTSQVEDRR